MANPESDDAAWDALVAQFGAPPSVDQVAAEMGGELISEPDQIVQPEDPVFLADVAGERFVPPSPPPVTLPPIDRLIAWICLMGGPALLLLCLFLNVRPPVVLTLLGLGAIVGSFIYLVVATPRHLREGWDDGAQI